jgi:hypothetical protein
MNDTPSIVRRCTICALSFPNEDMWRECAQCGEPTAPMSNAEANISTATAVKMLRNREFEEYVAQREAGA